MHLIDARPPTAPVATVPGAEAARLAPPSVSAPLTSMAPAPRQEAAAAPEPPAPPPPPADTAVTDDDLEESPVETRAPSPESNPLESSLPVLSSNPFAGPIPAVGGETWQDAANMGDWASVAQLIDGLPEDERGSPGARYARAVAGRELGQCAEALRALEGLEELLPLLHDEIQETRAHCQVEVGPYEAAYQFFTRDQTPENLILAARASLGGGDAPRALQTLERALAKTKKIGSESRRGRRNEIAARRLRAQIAQAQGQPKVAARDWLWLATTAPTDEAANQADDTYEQLSGQKLTKAQRFGRMREFSEAGQLEHTLREHARFEAAPGVGPAEVDVTSTLAWAYYRSRRDYLKAAELFQKAAARATDADNRLRFAFFEARALSRANEDDRAVAAFRALATKYPGSRFAEQADYSIARVEYGRGRWAAAERAYSDYLDRYAKRGGGQFAAASRYELAVARLGAKERTGDAAAMFAQLARAERRSERRSLYTELEAVALELTGEPKNVEAAVQRYRSIIDAQPLSFAALASAARLEALGHSGALRARLGSSAADTALGGFVSELDLPPKARLLSTLGLRTDAERALFAERESVRKLYAEREGQALCELYGSLDRGFRAYALADGLFDDSEALRGPPASHNWWAWRCAYPRPYKQIVSSVEERYNLPSSIVHSVMRQESNFRPNVVSPVGAIGLMQLMPGTALRAAEEITQRPGAPWVPDPRRPTNVLNNVELGGFYLGKLLDMLKGQLPVAIAAYNAGPIVVSRWLEGGEDLPADVWVARIPYAETRDYVSRVLGNLIAYRYLDSPKDLPELKLALIPGTRATPDAY